MRSSFSRWVARLYSASCSWSCQTPTNQEVKNWRTSKFWTTSSMSYKDHPMVSCPSWLHSSVSKTAKLNTKRSWTSTSWGRTTLSSAAKPTKRKWRRGWSKITHSFAVSARSITPNTPASTPTRYVTSALSIYAANASYS